MDAPVKRWALRILSFLLVLPVATLVFACDPGRELVIRNESSTDVVFVAASEPNREIRIPPGDEFEAGVLEGRNFGTFKLRGSDGEVLFDGDLTWAELQQIEFRLVVDASGVRAPMRTR